MKPLQIGLTVGSALAVIFFFGWVAPDFAYTRRLSKEKADVLLQEFKKLYLKNWLNVRDSSLPKLTAEESARWNEIKKKMIMAGYKMDVSVNESTAEIESSLSYPEYAR